MSVMIKGMVTNAKPWILKISASFKQDNYGEQAKEEVEAEESEEKGEAEDEKEKDGML